MIWKMVRSEPIHFIHVDLCTGRRSNKAGWLSDYHEYPSSARYGYAGLLLTCRLVNIEASCLFNPIRVSARIASLHRVIQTFQSRPQFNIDKLSLLLDYDCPIGTQTFDADRVQSNITTALVNLKRYYTSATFTKINFLWVFVGSRTSGTGHPIKFFSMACDFAVRSPLPHSPTISGRPVPFFPVIQSPSAEAVAKEKQILQDSHPLRDFDRLLNQDHYVDGSPILPGTDNCIVWDNDPSMRGWMPFRSKHRIG